MQIPNSPEKSRLRPYETDVEYLMAEVDWIRVRAERIEATRLLEAQNRVTPRPGFWRNRVAVVQVSSDTVASLTAEEASARQEIDARVAVNRTEGPGLGLDRLCVEFGLNEVERHIVLLGFVPILGGDQFADSVCRVDAVTTSSYLSFGLVSSFMELDPESHLKGLRSLLPDAPLVAKEMIRLTYLPATPSDAVEVGLELSAKALAMMTAIPQLSGYSSQD